MMRLPVFTGFPVEKPKKMGADGLLLKQIENVDQFILRDSFWSAQIAQINITPSRTFEMIPVVGNHLIDFGDGENYKEKFDKLYVFYKEVLGKTGFDKYARVDLRFENEIVCTKKGGAIRKSDSLQAA